MNKQLTLMIVSLLAINAVPVNARTDRSNQQNESLKMVQLNSWFQELTSKSNLLKSHEVQPLRRMGEGVNKLGANWNNTWKSNATDAYNSIYNPGAQSLLNSVNNSINSLREKFTTPRRSDRFRVINQLLDDLKLIINNVSDKVNFQVKAESPKNIQGAAQVGNVNNIFSKFVVDIQTIKQKTDRYLAKKGD